MDCYDGIFFAGWRDLWSYTAAVILVGVGVVIGAILRRDW